MTGWEKEKAIGSEPEEGECQRGRKWGSKKVPSTAPSIRASAASSCKKIGGGKHIRMVALEHMGVRERGQPAATYNGGEEEEQPTLQGG